MSPNADNFWNLASPNINKLCKGFLHLKNETLSSHDIGLGIDYSFFRKYPLTAKDAHLANLIKLDYSHLHILFNMICLKNLEEQLLIEGSHNNYQIIKLPSAGNTVTPFIVEDPQFVNDFTLFLSKDSESSNYYWNAVSNTDKSQGITFYTISDSYSPVTFGFSVLAFYISIVYVAGRLLRLVTDGDALSIIMTDMKHPENLNLLCSGVYVSRMISDLKREEELYFELLDVLRSPQILKHITGNSSIKEKID